MTSVSSSALAQLQGLIGLSAVKEEVRKLYFTAKDSRERRRQGMPEIPMSRHLVFTGNPGTGKTTVARAIAGVYAELGVLPKNQMIEVSRADLVGTYVGHTEEKTREVVERARGGILFIDEAYALVRAGDSGVDFGQKVVDTLVALMENLRNELVVIVAGYPAEMETFIASNPGLKSRFTRTIHFPDYSDQELLWIFRELAEQSGLVVSQWTMARAGEAIKAMPRGRGFGNGREARKLLQACVERLAERLASVPEPTRDQLRELLPEDIDVPRESASHPAAGIGVPARPKTVSASGDSRVTARSKKAPQFGQRSPGDGEHQQRMRLAGFGVSDPAWRADIALDATETILGRRVRHRVFGEGVVVQEDGARDRVVRIRFADEVRDVPMGLGLIDVEVA